jgi:hypothetical protein
MILKDQQINQKSQANQIVGTAQSNEEIGSFSGLEIYHLVKYLQS